MLTAFAIKILLNNVLMMLVVVDVAPVVQLSNFLNTAHALHAGSVEIFNCYHNNILTRSGLH